MNPRTGRIKKRALLGGIALGGIVVVGLVLAARGDGKLGEAELSVPLAQPGSPSPTYVKRLSAAPIDSHRIAFAWVAESAKDGDILWVCTVMRQQDGALVLDGKPEQVDHRSIGDITVVAHGGTYGLVYVKNGDLVCRWPYNAPARPLGDPASQSVFRSTAIGGPAVGTIAFGRTTSSITGRLALELVGYVLTADGARETRIAEVYLPRKRIGQSAPQAFLNGDGVKLGLVIAGGRLVEADAPIESLVAVSRSAGEVVVLELSVTPEHRLRIDHLSRFALPAEPSLEHMSNVAILDSSMRAFVTAGGIVRLVTLRADSTKAEQLSSSTGCGEMYAAPTVQALSTSDTTALVTWIDTEKTLSRMSHAHEGYDPTVYGGEIHARLVTPQGDVISKRIPGFPIHTQAQCIRTAVLGGHPLIAWIEASDQSLPPRPVALHISMLGAGKRR